MMSPNLKQKLRSCFKNSLPQLTNRPPFLFHFKDVIPEELQSRIGHKVSCGNCNATYFGETQHHLIVISSECIATSHNRKQGRIQTIFSFTA